MSYEFSRSDVRVAAQAANSMVRFFFYGAGIFAFVVMGLLAHWIWSRLPYSHAAAKAQPAFEFAANSLSGRPQIRKAENNIYGWVESLQYGQLYDRDVDMTVLMVVPSESRQHLTRDYYSEIAALRPIAGRSHRIGGSSGVTFYDLETRFGELRASEFSISADGRTKLCISYLSRFESPAFFLKGWYCEANGARPNFREVACIIDKLALNGKLPSADATGFIKERMKRSQRCTAEPVTQTTDNSPRRPLKRLVR